MKQRHGSPEPPEDALRQPGTPIAELERAALLSPGETNVETRAAAFDGGVLSTPLAEYVDKVRRHSYKVTESDIGRLVAAGFSEDAVFEVTVAAALGAASERLHAGMTALQGETVV
jgi:hypothetical protein